MRTIRYVLSVSLLVVGALVAISGGGLLDASSRGGSDAFLPEPIAAAADPALAGAEQVSDAHLADALRHFDESNEAKELLDGLSYTVDEVYPVTVENADFGLKIFAILDEPARLTGPWIRVNIEALRSAARPDLDVDAWSGLAHEADSELMAAGQPLSLADYETESAIVDYGLVTGFSVTISPETGQILKLAPDNRPVDSLLLEGDESIHELPDDYTPPEPPRGLSYPTTGGSASSLVD